MKRLNNLYEQLTPLTTAEELSQKIMNPEMKITARKRPSRAVTAILAAALSVSALTLTAGAVNNWDYAGIFRNLFGESSENISGNILPEATVLKDTIDTMDFEIAAAAADKHSTLVILDIYSENGYKLVEKDVDGNDIIHPLHDLLISVSSRELGAYGISVGAIEASEEKVRLAIKMSTENNLKDKKLLLNLSLKNTYDEQDQHIIDQENVWSAELTSVYSREEISYEKEISVFNADITNVEISPVSLYFSGRNLQNIQGKMGAYGETFVLLDNGEKVIINNITFSGYTEGDDTGSDLLIIGFETPVNPETVCKMGIADTIIEIK